MSSKKADAFLERNHLQGACAGTSIYLGCYQGDTLVALMTFGTPRFNSNYQWELLRFCTERNTQIVGAASKLLSYFLDKYTGRIISYANLRFSYGNLYRKLGFKFLRRTSPSYFYTRGGEIVSRYKAQKHKLEQLIPNFVSAMSEKQNMEANGYYRVWDCGNLVFKLNRR